MANVEALYPLPFGHAEVTRSTAGPPNDPCDQSSVVELEPGVIRPNHVSHLGPLDYQAHHLAIGAITR
jgi:hypothetical protein